MMELFQITTTSKDMLEEVDVLAEHLNVFNDRGP
jgi:hypothetical protein